MDENLKKQLKIFACKARIGAFIVLKQGIRAALCRYAICFHIFIMSK